MTRRILVTGASSGIGKAIAIRLAGLGMNVFGTSRRGVADAAGPFQMLPLDVRSDDSVHACLEEVNARAGGLDVLVNNAGYALTGAAEETSVEEAMDQFDANFFGVVRMTNAALPALRRGHEPRIVNIGSLVGLMGIPFMPFYTASKFALEGYSEALWHELRPLGIPVSIVEPTWVRSALAASARNAVVSLPAYKVSEAIAMERVDAYVVTGVRPERVANRVVEIIHDPSPQLRYPVGADATWLPRLRAIGPWRLFAAGVRRRFGLTA